MRSQSKNVKKGKVPKKESSSSGIIAKIVLKQSTIKAAPDYLHDRFVALCRLQKSHVKFRLIVLSNQILVSG